MAGNTNSMMMYLAGGACADFIPWDLTLEEGFSRLYRGELTVLSETKHGMEDLSGLLDKGISLTMTQKAGLDTDVLRTRYLHGIVTEVRSAGVFSNGKAKDCYSYVLVIEPELARLRFTRLTAPYYRMNPLSIFEAILNKYKLTARIEQGFVSRAKYGGNLLFDQSETSDMDFLTGIAGIYGISLVFTHQKKPPNTLGVTDLYFSDGGKFPRSDISYSDKREEPPVENFVFLGASGNAWKMDRWTMTETIGFEGNRLGASYPNVNYGSDEWKWGKTGAGDRYANYGRLFHSYEPQTAHDEVDRDIKLILEVRRRVAEQAKARWTAEAANLVLRPGLILELRHFYGMKDRELITALVTGITLHHRARWPENLAVRMEEAGEEMTQVGADCMDWGSSAEKRFCPNQQ
ncbi:MAG: hypothetical protein LBD44_01055 [Spirochaetaceae bacterium]|nr:hypothetical protein [Spirochaetaceae bacterium]